MFFSPWSKPVLWDLGQGVHWAQPPPLAWRVRHSQCLGGHVMRLSCQAVTSAGFVILPVLRIFPFSSFFGGGGGEIRCYMVCGFIPMCSRKLLYFPTILQAFCLNNLDLPEAAKPNS